MKVSIRHSAELVSLHQHVEIKAKSIKELFPQYSLATHYRHSKKELELKLQWMEESSTGGGHLNLVLMNDLQSWVVPKLRVPDGSLTAPRIVKKARVASKFHNRSVRRVLINPGYQHNQSRKTRIFIQGDLNARLELFCRIWKSKMSQNFWNKHVVMYLDAKGFQFKTKPLDQARASRA